MPDVVLIRPGCTDFDEQNRIQGVLDLPLSPRGQEQVRELIEQLHDVSVDVIFTAPSEPARSTATAIGSALGVSVKELDGLRNLDQGLWQGLLLEDVRRKYPKVFKQLQESPETICPPQGETVPEALERIEKSLKKPLKRKHQFAIVASEPVATLVRCVLRGCKPATPMPICGCASNGPLVEVVSAGGELVAATANGTVNGKDVPSNGAHPHQNGKHPPGAAEPVSAFKHSPPEGVTP